MSARASGTSEVSEIEALFRVLWQSANPGVAAAIESAVAKALGQRILAIAWNAQLNRDTAVIDKAEQRRDDSWAPARLLMLSLLGGGAPEDQEGGGHDGKATDDGATRQR